MNALLKRKKNKKRKKSLNDTNRGKMQLRKVGSRPKLTDKEESFSKQKRGMF